MTTKPAVGRLGAALARRRTSGPNSPAALSGPSPMKAGGIVKVPEDAKPLTDILHKARVETRPARVGEFVHVSDLLARCIRKFALSETLGHSKPPQGVSIAAAITYAQGEVIHDVVRARAAVGGPRTVWGNWKCLCGSTRTNTPCFYEVVKDTTCPTCRSSLTTYVEVSMFDRENMIVGNPDLLLWLPDLQALYIEEIKSIAPDAWKELVRPDPDHVIQVLFYWYLMRLNGYRITNRVSIIYFTKGFTFRGDPWKEFTLDAEKEVHRLGLYLEMARQLKAFRAGGELPNRSADCPTETTTKAKNCEHCRACFGSTNERPTTINFAETFKAQQPAKPVRLVRPRART